MVEPISHRPWVELEMHKLLELRDIYTRHASICKGLESDAQIWSLELQQLVSHAEQSQQLLRLRLEQSERDARRRAAADADTSANRAARKAAEKAFREERERVMREKEEGAKRARAKEREAYEEAMNAFRAERERAMKEKEETARRAEEERARAASELYDNKWNELKKSETLVNGPVGYHEFPFPLFTHDPDQAPRPADIAYDAVSKFVLSPLRQSLSGKTPRERIRSEMLRWHPDKFDAVALPKMREEDKAMTKEAALRVSQFLTRMLGEENKQTKGSAA